MPQSADLELPASASRVAMWFTITNVWGCNAYDSAFGENYNFVIEHHGLGSVAFDTDWTQTQSGAIHPGDHVVVHYEPDRLRQCAGSTGGHPAWAGTGRSTAAPCTTCSRRAPRPTTSCPAIRRSRSRTVTTS